MGLAQDLLQQAEHLALYHGVNATQADFRRAVSTAYYALFHAASINAADAVAGAGNRNSERYALIYRSINHASLVTVCEAIAKDRAGLRPEGGFSADFKRFAAAEHFV